MVELSLIRKVYRVCLMFGTLTYRLDFVKCFLASRANKLVNHFSAYSPTLNREYGSRVHRRKTLVDS
jgi:hypothetical protein